MKNLLFVLLAILLQSTPVSAQEEVGRKTPDRMLRTRTLEDGGTLREISFEGGWFEVTSADTLGRYYTSRGDQAIREAVELGKELRGTAKNPWRVYFAICNQITADWRDKDGSKKTTSVEMNNTEVRRCLRAFQSFTELVLAYTNGALIIDSRIDVLSRPVTQVYPVSEGKYWVPPHRAVNVQLLRKFKPDSIIFYCKPGDIPIADGMMGATYGSDRGILGAGVTSIHIPDGFFRIREESPMNLVTLVTLREFMQQISYSGKTLLGYSVLPSMRAAPEYGYKLGDLGLIQWTNAVADFMKFYYPSAFWQNARMGILSSKLKRSSAPWIPNRLCSYNQVIDQWPTSLPQITSVELESITGIPGIIPRIGQFETNGPCYAFLETPENMHGQKVLPEPLPSDREFNNQLSLNSDNALESMAVLRIPDKFDLIVVRMDVAEKVLSALVTEQDRSANRCILGYISAPDPTEGNPINFLVAQTRFGTTLPGTELEAITGGKITELAPSGRPEEEGNEENSGN